MAPEKWLPGVEAKVYNSKNVETTSKFRCEDLVSLIMAHPYGKIIFSC